MIEQPPSPLRLLLDGDALVANWRWLAERSGPAACGAAVKANGYGVGAEAVVRRLRAAGCKDFYVATWAEALALNNAGEGEGIAVLHGARAEDMPTALALSSARPVLNTATQIARWKDAAPGRACDVMVDTGMNRLGISATEAQSGLLDGLLIDTVMSHLASADEDSALNQRQCAAFAQLAAAVPARRYSLANSAGICLGSAFQFDLTRPGLALYGGVPRFEAEGHIRQVVQPQAQLLQRRRLMAGEGIGYNHLWQAPVDTDVAILHIGYADGYLRSFTNTGAARMANGVLAPVVGRVSMDLTAIALPSGCDVAEGDWIDLDFALEAASTVSGLSPYELLTLLGARYDRQWR